jgi:hypothetical protein
MSGFLGLIFGNSAGGSGPPPVTPSEYIAFGGYEPSARISVFPWNSSTGYGTKYTSAATTVGSQIVQVSFVSDNSNFSCSGAAAYLDIWRWSSLGFGTRYANPTSLLNPSSGGIQAYTWTSNIDAVLCVNRFNSTFPQAWAWNSTTGIGTKYSNGSVVSTSAFSTSMTLNADSSIVAVAFRASPYVCLYPWSSSTGFGTRLADPTALPSSVPSNYLGLSFNKVTNDLVCGHQQTPFAFAYPVTSSGFGTKYLNPSPALGSATNGLRFSPDGATFASVNGGSTTVNAYQWGAGFGTKYADPVLPPYAIAMDWQSTGNAVATSQDTSAPYRTIYPWSSSGFGTKYSDPGIIRGASLTLSFANQSR